MEVSRPDPRSSLQKATENAARNVREKMRKGKIYWREKR